MERGETGRSPQVGMVGMKTRAPLPPVLRQAGKSRVVFISGPKTRGSQPQSVKKRPDVKIHTHHTHLLISFLTLYSTLLIYYYYQGL